MKLTLDRMEMFAAMAMQGLLASGDEADDAELVEIAWSIASAMETKAIKRHERLKASAPPVEAKPAKTGREEVSPEDQIAEWLADHPKGGSHKGFRKWAAAARIPNALGKVEFSKLMQALHPELYDSSDTAPPKDLTPDEQFAAWRAAEPNGEGFDQFHKWAAANRIAQHMGRKQFEAMVAPVPAPPPPPPARAA